MSAPKVVVRDRTLMRVQGDSEPMARCIVCSKVITHDKRVGTTTCSRRCGQRAYRMRRDGVEPDGSYVTQPRGVPGGKASALNHWRRRSA